MTKARKETKKRYVTTAHAEKVATRLARVLAKRRVYPVSPIDDGACGKCFDMIWGDRKWVAMQGKVDTHIDYTAIECKTGSSTLGYSLPLLPKAKTVLYCPVFFMNDDGTPNMEASFPIYYLTREDFLEGLEVVGLIRYTNDSKKNGGKSKWKINTIWHKNTNDPHGTKVWELMDEFEKRALLILND